MTRRGVREKKTKKQTFYRVDDHRCGLNIARGPIAGFGFAKGLKRILLLYFTGKRLGATGPVNLQWFSEIPGSFSKMREILQKTARERVNNNIMPNYYEIGFSYAVVTSKTTAPETRNVLYNSSTRVLIFFFFELPLFLARVFEKFENIGESEFYRKQIIMIGRPDHYETL